MATAQRQQTEAVTAWRRHVSQWQRDVGQWRQSAHCAACFSLATDVGYTKLAGGRFACQPVPLLGDFSLCWANFSEHAHITSPETVGAMSHRVSRSRYRQLCASVWVSSLLAACGRIATPGGVRLCASIDSKSLRKDWPNTNMKICRNLLRCAVHTRRLCFYKVEGLDLRLIRAWSGMFCECLGLCACLGF